MAIPSLTKLEAFAITTILIITIFPIDYHHYYHLVGMFITFYYYHSCLAIRQS